MSWLARARRRFVFEARTRGWWSAIRLVFRYVARRLRGAHAQSPAGLASWLAVYGRLDPPRVGEAVFSVVCPAHDTPGDLLRACARSVITQTYPKWELVLVDDGSTAPGTKAALRDLAASDPRIKLVELGRNGGIAVATNAGADHAAGEYLVFLDHDDLLAPTALAWLSTCTPDADLIYTDEDRVYEGGSHRDAFFKPAWSPRLLLGVNYVNHLTCVRTAVFRRLGGLQTGIDGVQDHDFLLRLCEHPGLKVAHLPNVLYHWRAWSGSYAGPIRQEAIEAAGVAMVAETIARRGWNAHAGAGDRPFTYRVVFDPEPEPPLIKVVLPTRDRLDLLAVAVDGVLERTDGVRVHLVVVDNGSREPRTLSYLEDLERINDRVTVCRIDEPFNYSRLCNQGVRTGPDAPYVLLLNNDIVVSDPRWLLQLSGWLRDPEVGGVGPLLLYPDGRIQHAGVIVGLGGIAGHYAGHQANEPRLGSLHDQAREVGCLTAACLLLRTADYLEVGGMDEGLPVDFQDVDLCLRLRRDLGLSLVYDPAFPLTHVESATRGEWGSSAATVARMQRRWAHELASPDPYYSPHLTLDRHDGSLAPIPGSAVARRFRVQGRDSPTGTR